MGAPDEEIAELRDLVLLALKIADGEHGDGELDPGWRWQLEDRARKLGISLPPKPPKPQPRERTAAEWAEELNRDHRQTIRSLAEAPARERRLDGGKKQLRGVGLVELRDGMWHLTELGREVARELESSDAAKTRQP